MLGTEGPRPLLFQMDPFSANMSSFHVLPGPAYRAVYLPYMNTNSCDKCQWEQSFLHFIDWKSSRLISLSRCLSLSICLC